MMSPFQVTGGGPKTLPQGLLRLFESSCFNMEIALQYLQRNDCLEVVMYLGECFGFPCTLCSGRILHRFDPKSVDFFIPQLITLYINTSQVASAIHNYMIERCKASMEFSLECYWLLDAYGVEQFKTHQRKAQGFFLRETIFNEYMRSQQPLLRSPAAAAALHHRSRSDARLAEAAAAECSSAPCSPPPDDEQGPNGCPAPPTSTTQPMRRAESTRSIRSMYTGAGVADLSSGESSPGGPDCCPLIVRQGIRLGLPLPGGHGRLHGGPEPD